MTIEGILRKDRVTKRLILRLKRGNIALICHRDIDSIASQALLGAGVRCVLNCQTSFSGEIPTTGALFLLREKVPVVDLNGDDAFEKLKDGKTVTVDLTSGRVMQGEVQLQGTVLDEAQIEKSLEKARRRFKELVNEFAENTLTHLKAQGNRLLYAEEFLPVPPGLFAGRAAVVVIRGPGYKEDLRAIRNFIRDRKPVLIGVDGGADALLELGLRPDFIVGDMDSVSDEALRCGARLIVHGYEDGRAPGLNRLKEIGLEGAVFPSGGTSEDAGYLLAHNGGADVIIAVGARFSALEFLEKGRKGMASTFLVRLKVGDRLIDAKGVRVLYSSGFRWWHIGALVAAGAVAWATLVVTSPSLGQFVRTLWLWFRTSVEQLWLRWW